MTYLGRAHTLKDIQVLCALTNPEAKLNFNGKTNKPGADLWYDEATNEILFI